MRIQSTLSVLFALLSVAASAAAQKPDIAISVELGGEPIKDLRKSRSMPDLGYAGSVTDVGAFAEAFLKDPDLLWEKFRDSGAHFVKQWGSNSAWHYSQHYAGLKTEEERQAFHKNFPAVARVDPKRIFEWRKEHGIKILMCIDCRSVRLEFNDPKSAESTEIGDVKREILRFVQWIVDNGYKDQVVGFELGNEPYFNTNPEEYAARWSQIVPEIKRIFPECDIGIPIAEYRANDPDIAAVRARSTTVDKWFAKGSEFGFQKVNQWSGRFIVAMSNCLDLCSHVIYHFYGGDAAYGCGPAGFARIRNFAKIFPEVKDKRVWITEWRERSDEDMRCHQMHSSTIFKSLYMMSALCQPEIDGICLHNGVSISGGMNVSNGANWYFQQDTSRRRWLPDLDRRCRIETGPCGPLFKLYNEALLGHPLLLKHGTNDSQGPECGYWNSANYYAFHGKKVRWLMHEHGVPEKNPGSYWNAEWLAATDPGRSTVVVLCCNAMERPWRPTFSIPGRKIGKARFRLFGCDPDQAFLHQVPGEGKPTWERDFTAPGNKWEIPAYTVATVEIPVGSGKGVK